MDKVDQQEEDFIKQHIVDCEKTKETLKTMKCNIPELDSEAWQKCVTVRTEHCDAYIKALKNEQKRFDHFK